jgi:urease accessory protein
VGARAVRITRDELVTPPEFRGLHPAEHPAARVGGARIELVRVGDETRLGSCYQQVPVRLMPPFVLDAEPASLLYLINLTAGLMDGDGHRIEINARAGTRAVVTGQSATRVHPAVASYATQQWTVEVENDACLVVLPGPTIPFRGSRYFQRGRVVLAPRARLIWGDIWLAGRYDRGALSERFQFERIVQDFEARRGGRLIYRDRFRWDGPWTPESAGWYFGGALASGSLFIAGPVPDALTEAGPDLRRSVFRLDTGASCMRWCGHPTAVTADLVHNALRLAAGWTVGPDAPPWLLASSGLAPNHWFSTPLEKHASAAVRP